MPLSDLAQRGVRHAAIGCNLAPVPLSGRQRLQNCGVDWLVHGADYPHTDIFVNPHMDVECGHNSWMPTLREIVAKNVRTRMKAGALRTQPRLAEKAGIAQSHVSRIVNGASGITIDRLELVARALNCEPYEFLIDDESARRALIERLMSGPAVPTERVEQAGFIPMPNEDDGHPDPLEKPHEPLRRYNERIPPGRLKIAKTAAKKK